MARVTVEDCLEFVDNRFKLVLLASKRARQLAMGMEPLVEWENDKPTVVSLREIEQGLVNEEMMKAALAEPVEEESEYNEDDLAAALHAEISRELNQPAPGTSLSAPQAESVSEESTQNFSNTFFTRALEAAAKNENESSESLQTSGAELDISKDKLPTEELPSVDTETPNIFGGMAEQEAASSAEESTSVDKEVSESGQDQGFSTYSNEESSSSNEDDPSSTEGGQGF